MIVRTLRLLLLLSVAGGTALLVMSCSLPLPRNGQGQAASAHVTPPIRKIAQRGFGRHASFATCAASACPAVTRKTLPLTPPQATGTAAPVLDIASTLSPGEEHLRAPRYTVDANAKPAAIPRTPVVVHFASGSSALSASGKAVLNQAMPDMRHVGRILIIGRTDSTGSRSANQSLALARARTVRDYMKAGLSSPAPAPVLVLDAQGACCFAASNDTLQGRQQNRRVEIVFSVHERATP